jgi:hypothetical protein
VSEPAAARTARTDWRAVVARYAGTIVACAAAVVVGALFVWSARQQGLPVDAVRAFALLPGLALGGLGLDHWQMRAPALGLAYLQRATLYWAAVFPWARLLQDLIAYLHYYQADPTLGLAELFPAFASPAAFVGWAVFQAVCGVGFGFGCGILARRLSHAVARG